MTYRVANSHRQGTWRFQQVLLSCMDYGLFSKILEENIYSCKLKAFAVRLGRPAFLFVDASWTGLAESGGPTMLRRIPIARMCLHICCLKNPSFLF